jgi:non-canonical poly(A) RNA polymerase PAPD5/7
VREALPNHILEVFGSERTGIALATSDIDFRLLSHEDVALSSAGLPPPPQSRKHLLDQLYKLYRKRLQRNKNYVLPMLRHARYPLISFQDRASGIDCQIVLSNDTSRSREYMQQYMQEYPYLRQVYTVVKTTFDVRGLSDVFRGGFGSYSIFMMLVASLKHHPNPRQDAAGALRNFFFFWGQFETSLEGISIDPPVKFNKSEELVMSEKAKAQLEVRSYAWPCTRSFN